MSAKDDGLLKRVREYQKQHPGEAPAASTNRQGGDPQDGPSGLEEGLQQRYGVGNGEGPPPKASKFKPVPRGEYPEDQQGDQYEQQHSGEAPPPPRFKFISSAEFARTDYRLEWIVKRLLVRGQPTILAGPKKALKTSLLVDLALSLGTGTKFLGHFDVYKRLRVAIASGESGEATLKETALRICNAKGIELASADVLWGFKLPQLADPSQVAELQELLKAHAVDVFGYDPTYLGLLAGIPTESPQVKPSDVFAMGVLLQRVAEACLSVNCTPRRQA